MTDAKKKSLANLRRYGKDVPPPTKEQAKEAGIKGGYASQAKQRQIKTFKEMIEIALQREMTLNDGTKSTTLEGLVIAQLEKALSGDSKAFEVIRDSGGQKPTDKVTVDASNINLNIDTDQLKEEIRKARKAKNGEL